MSKILIYFVLISVFLSGCIDNKKDQHQIKINNTSEYLLSASPTSVPTTKILNATPDEEIMIKNALNQTQTEIHSVSVAEYENFTCNYINDAIGCTSAIQEGTGKYQFDIQLVHDNTYGLQNDGTMHKLGTFETTLYHEIGHVKCISNYNDKTENCANNYESDITINHREKFIQQ